MLSRAAPLRSNPTSEARVVRQTLWMGAITAVKFLASIIQMALSARILGPEGLGILAVIIAVPALLFGFMALPGHETITTFVTRSLSAGRREEAAGTLCLAFAASLGLAMVSYALLPVFSFAASELIGIEQIHRSTLLWYGVTGLFMSTVLASTAVLRLTDQLRLGFAITVGSLLTRIVVITVAWLTDGGLFMVAMSYVAGAAVEGVGLFIAAAISIRRGGLPVLSMSLLLRVPRDVVRFQIMTFFQTKAGALSGTIDVILMSAFTSADQVGMYRAARQMIEATRLSIQPIAHGLQVEYSRRYYTSGGSLRELSRRFTTLSVALAIMIYGLLALFHAPIIRAIFGSEFTGIAQPLLILILGSFAFMSIGALYGLPAATGRAEPLLIATWISLTAMVMAIVLLVPTHGAKGAAWANTAYFLVNVGTTIPFVLAALFRSRNRDGS